MITRRLGRSPDFEGAASSKKFQLSNFNFWTLKVRTVGWKEAPQEGTLSPTHPGLASRQVSLVRVSFGFGVLSDISVSFGVKARLNLVS